MANYQKLKTNLQIAVNRLKLLEKKNTEMSVKARREIADYLAASKTERARIRVEHIIREDFNVEAMEIIEMYCDLLLARMGLIQCTKELDPGLEESVASIIWATPRMQGDVPELATVSKQLAAKYGKEYAESCRANTLCTVNEKLLVKLSVQAPPTLLVDRYLQEIAAAYHMTYEPGSCSTTSRETRPDIDTLPIPASVPSAARSTAIDPDFDDLNRRFENLKKK